ncbi:hypothetical protein [Pseudoxanthomonas kalamensis]|uniref:hypothetical protein n=1 Tax=Pseudoxanthomonas kalamensis TaxID=289483 RepID=UPI00139176D6|nr:hypothetical protein [Pseudoxanthomonas kalamensis]
MVYYGTSVFYPIIGKSHDQIVRYAAGAVRQPVFLINDAIAPLPDGGIPQDTKIALLDDREHVVTVQLSNSSAQFSQSHKDIAVVCALNGWLEVKQ